MMYKRTYKDRSNTYHYTFFINDSVYSADVYKGKGCYWCNIIKKQYPESDVMYLDVGACEERKIADLRKRVEIIIEEHEDLIKAAEIFGTKDRT